MKKINFMKKGKKHLSQSVYVFPSLFTIASMYCAFFSIASSVEGKLSRAAVYIGISIILDGLDGRIARALNAHTDMGLQLDSLADIIAFGVAPAILIYYWAFHPYYGGYYSRAGFLAAFLFLMCSAVRLAKFNIISVLSDKRFFIGLPTPGSAAVIAALVHYYPHPLKASYASLSAIVLLIILSYLMISKIKYFSFKTINLRSQKSYLYIIAAAVVIASILTFSQLALISLATIYLLSGIVMRLMGLKQKQLSPSAITQEKKASASSTPNT